MQVIRRLRDLAAKNVAVISVALAVLIGATSWYQMDQQHRQAERLNRVSHCQAQFNKAFAEQLRIRSDIFQRADETRNALLGGVASLILAPRDPNEDPAVKAERDRKFRSLFQDYLKSTQEVEDARKNTPLPPIPDCV